jgi:hypothetical protein
MTNNYLKVLLYLVLLLSCISACSPSSFWCRKLGNRQCFTSEKTCTKGPMAVLEASGRFECFSSPTAWCFFNDNPYSGEQMICVGHKADCEDWRKDRKGNVGACLKTSPKEFPKDHN